MECGEVIINHQANQGFQTIIYEENLLVRWFLIGKCIGDYGRDFSFSIISSQFMSSHVQQQKNQWT